MKTQRKCPACGSSIPDYVSGGFCPHCSFVGAISLGGEPLAEDEIEPTQSLPGQKLGDFELIEEIGRGGMGVVFKANQISLNRIVAVKMLLHGRFSDPAFRRRFRLEAEAAANLEHQNIVSIHEIGEYAGQPFFSMGWVDGPSLDQQLMDGPLPIDRCTQIVATLAHAVHHAHQHGILHRDLKPHNVIIDAAGEPHLTDFGLAKLLDDNSGLTMSETVLGSPGYVAPEQAAGLNASVTTAADIFSLGAMLYAMLTGEPPFTGETPLATLHKVMACDPVRPSARVPSLPRALETICLKCLQKEPSRRYSSAEALAEDLERWMRNEPILARPVSDVERVWLWCRRRPWRAGLIAGLAASVLVGAVGIVSQWRRAEDASRRAEAGRLQAMRETYAAQISLARALTTQGQLDEAREVLLDAGPESLRGWEWGWLQRECNQDLMTLGAEGVGHSDCAFSPDGQLIITGSEDGALRIWDLEAPATPQVLQDSDEASVVSLALSPDGRTAVTTHEGRPAKVWDLGKRAVTSTLDTGPNWIARATFSPDGDVVATGSVDGVVQMWHHRTGEPIREVARYARGTVRALAFNPDGSQLAFAGGSTDPSNRRPADVCLLDLQTGSLRRIAGHESSVMALAFSPDGTWLASAGLDGTVRIKRARGDDPLTPLYSRMEGSIYTALTFSPDSRQLMVAAAGAAELGVLDTIDIAFSRLTRRGTGLRQPVRSVVYHPDGSLFATAADDGTVRLWPVQSHPGFLSLEGHNHDVWAVAASPDGRYAATGSLDHTAKIWDMSTGRLVHTIRVHYPVVSVAFTADSKNLVTNAPENTASVWPIAGGDAVLELRGHEGFVFAVAVDPTGRWIATGSRDKTIRLWDAENGAHLRSFSGSVLYVGSVAFSPDGERLAAGGLNGRSAVWESQTGLLVCAMHGHGWGVTSLHFSPDGTRLATGGIDGFARIWNANTGEPVGHPMKSRTSGMKCIAFSPDGRRLVTTGTRTNASGTMNENRSVTFWDLASGQRLWDFMPHRSGTYAVAFSPGGLRLITGAGDNTARIWSVFPWNMEAYLGATETAPAARLESFKRDFWLQAVEQPPSADRTFEVHPWGEENRPKHIEPKTRPELPIPARPLEAGEAQIDLLNVYNAALNEVWQPVVSYFCLDGDLAALPPGLHVFKDIAFDVRGAIQLAIDVNDWDHFPRSVTIPIERKIQRFHVLHATVPLPPREGDGAVVGAYRIHFEAGEPALQPIVYGRHLRSFWREGDLANACSDAEVVWEWTEPARREIPKYRRLFLATFQNPRPEDVVTSIEFVSGDTLAAPFLVAMTVE